MPPTKTKGYLSDTCEIPYESKANRVRYLLCDTIQKAADVWKKDVCDFQSFSQTFFGTATFPWK